MISIIRTRGIITSKQILKQKNCKVFSSNIKYITSGSNIKCNSNTDIEKLNENKLGGFAQAFERHNQEKIDEPEEIKSFSYLLRNSNFMDLGDPQGKTVTGKIFHIVDDDLYIDFGWKFHCVCTRPSQKPEKFVRGAKVRLRIKELELSTKFLGSEKDLTILEADCILLGLVE